MIDLNGQDIFVIGCGPSLKGFNFNILDDKFTLGINHLIEHYSDNLNAHIYSDTTFIKLTTYDMRDFEGQIFASKKSMHHPPIYQMRDQDNVTIFTDNRKEVTLDINLGLYHPTNTGLMALNLALMMNPGKIYLLGYDYYYDRGQMHFFEDYEHHKRYPEAKTQLKIKMFKPFEYYKNMIVNLSVHSRLELFKKIDWREVL